MVKQKKKIYIYTYIYIVYSDSCLENCIAEQGQLEVINLYLDALEEQDKIGTIWLVLEKKIILLPHTVILSDPSLNTGVLSSFAFQSF